MADRLKFVGSSRAQFMASARLKGKEVSEMRMKTANVVRAVARCVERLLAVRLPMGVVAGLRTR